MNETTKMMPGTITYTLLIWEQEDTRGMLVLIPNSALDEEAFALLRLVHNKCLNADHCTSIETDAIRTVSDALTSNPKHLSDANPIGSKWAQRFTQFIVDRGHGRVLAGPQPTSPIEEQIITRIYRTGWF